MFEPNASWSLPEHLFMVSEWSAFCTVAGDPFSCKNASQRVFNPSARSTGAAPGLRLDRPDLPAAQGRRQLGLLRPGGTQPDCDDERMTCPPKNSDPRRPESGTRCRTSTRSSRTASSATSRTDRQTFYASRGRDAARRVLGDPQRHRQRAPAGPGQRRPGLRHRADQRRHAGPGLEQHGDLPGLGRLGRLLRPRQPPTVDENGYGLRVPGLVISPYAKKGYIDHQTLSFDAYVKFIEDDFLGGQRLDPTTDGRPDPRPTVSRKRSPRQRDQDDFDSGQPPRTPLVLPLTPPPGPASSPGN